MVITYKRWNKFSTKIITVVVTMVNSFSFKAGEMLIC